MASRVLVVDDDPDTLFLMQRALERGGYEVVGAGSVAEAVAASEAAPVDLVVSDLGLPDGDGIELLTRIRERRQVPGIALTGSSLPEVIERARQAGFVRHMVKPVDLQAVRTAIAELLAAAAAG